jgi:iduronate 2-sulfatase
MKSCAHRISYVVYLLLAVLGVFVSTVFLSSSAFAEKRPNILFVVVDDLRNSVGVFGDELAITPNIDLLAKRGTVFVNAHCQIAICNPSRASVMTGLRPDTTRVWGLAKHFREDMPKVVTLPQLLKQQGYYTHSIGKIYHGTGRASVDQPSWSDAPLFDHVSKKDQYVLNENRTGKKAAATEQAVCKDSAYIDGKVADAAVAKLRALQRERRQKEDAKPFFLAVGFRKPHLPFSAPKKYWEMYDSKRLASLAKPSNAAKPSGAAAMATHDWPELRGYMDVPSKGPLLPRKIAQLRHGYYAAVSYMDAQLGRVLEGLKVYGFEQDTVIVLYSDHGFHLGEQQLWGKLTNYDIATNSPLLFVSPWQKRKGKVVNKAVEMIDIYPTVADLCGIKLSANLEGESLVKVLDDEHVAIKGFAISQFPRPVSYNFTKKLPNRMGYSIRTAHHRYTKWVQFESGRVVAEEFYDYSIKSGERYNRVNQLKGEVAGSMRIMKQKLNKITNAHRKR